MTRQSNLYGSNERRVPKRRHPFDTLPLPIVFFIFLGFDWLHNVWWLRLQL